MLFLGAALQVVAQALRAWKPPFGLFVVTFLLVCVGQGYQDTHGNTFVASTNSAHRGLAFIHAMYMAGCLCGPFVSTAVASANSPSQWYLFYLFPLGLGVINMCLVLYAFRDSLGFKRKTRIDPANIPGNVPGVPEQQLPETQDAADNNRALVLMRETLASRNVWLLSLFFFFFLGATLTASGWIVEYLVVVRDGDLSRMGYVPAGFSGGSLLGRLLLAEPTHRFGERRVICILTIISLAMQIIFWL
jgi:fucose permease